jgi:hypothetical protein
MINTQDVSENGTTAAPERKETWAYLALFLTAAATLAMELLCARVFSVTTLYSMSFFVVSTAMLGMTVGALLVYAYPEVLRPAAALPVCTTWFCVSLPLALAAAMNIPLPFAAPLSGSTFFLLGLVTLILSIPFILSGIVVSLTLTRCGLPYGRIYGMDLFGAAIGAELFIVGLGPMRPAALVFVLAALAAGAGFAYRRFFGLPARAHLTIGVPFCLLLALSHQRWDWGVTLLYAKQGLVNHEQFWYENWNNHSHVGLGKPGPGQPFLWGPSPLTPVHSTETAFLTIDLCAGTHMIRFDGDPASVRWLNDDVTSVAYQIQKPRQVAVIGVGAGRDALTALVADADHVVSIDVNSMIIDLLNGTANPEIGDFTRLGSQPKVSFVHDEARSYLATTADRYDVIQMSLIDTWSSNAAGAYTLTENGLYTREAFATFLGALSDRGLFTVSRFYHDGGLDETTRLVALAVSTCQAKGLPAAEHLALIVSGDVATMVLARTPLTGERLQRLQEVCAQRRFRILIQPGQAPDNGMYRRMLASASPEELDAVCKDHLLDIHPPTDDRPYFFNQLRLSRAAELYGENRAVAGLWNLHATLILMAALGTALAGLLAGILWPLKRVPFPKGLSRANAWNCLTYFIAIGLGYMFIEMALVQRLSVLLGHPSYALAVVIASMILASGLGSMLADRLPVDRRATFYVYPLVVLAVQAAGWWLLPRLFGATVGGTLSMRVAASLAITLPVGFVMGMCFPLGLVQASRVSPTLTPWLWGVNGAASVVGIILAVVLSMTFGISVTVLTGLFCYFVIFVVNLQLARNQIHDAPIISVAAVAPPSESPALS